MDELIRFTNNLKPISPESLKSLFPEKDLKNIRDLKPFPALPQISPGFILEYKLEISPGYSPEFKVEYPPGNPAFNSKFLTPKLNRNIVPAKRLESAFGSSLSRVSPDEKPSLVIKEEPISEPVSEPVKPRKKGSRSKDILETGEGKRSCRICGEQATGTHYKVLACEGCKSFWKRTIQRGASHLYRCRAGTLDCPVYTGTRSRCQQCRYLACVRAGMVADRVMSDKERKLRQRLVVQKTEKRKRDGDIPSPPELKTEGIFRLHDQETLVMFHIIYNKVFGFTPKDNFGEYKNSLIFIRELYKLFNIEQERGLGHIDPGAQNQVFFMRLAFTRDLNQLRVFPPLHKISKFLQSRRFGIVEFVQCVSLAVTRPRLSWPNKRRGQLTAVWKAVTRVVETQYPTGEPTRSIGFGTLIQFVHMSAYISNMLEITQVLNYLGVSPRLA